MEKACCLSYFLTFNHYLFLNLYYCHLYEQPLTTVLREQVLQLLKDASQSAAFRSTKRICVKLTADGTNMGKQHSCILVTFPLLDVCKTVASVDSVLPTTVIDVEEKYKQLKLSLSDIEELEDLKIHTMDEET